MLVSRIPSNGFRLDLTTKFFTSVSRLRKQISAITRLASTAVLINILPVSEGVAQSFDESSPLSNGSFAIQINDIGLLSALLDEGFDPNSTEKGFPPLLHQAAREGNLEAVKLLLNSGADINALDQFNGWTSVMAAASTGHEGLTIFLITHGAATNTVGLGGETLQYLIELSDIKIDIDTVKLLETIEIPALDFFEPIQVTRRIERLVKTQSINFPIWKPARKFVCFINNGVIFNQYFTDDQLHKLLDCLRVFDDYVDKNDLVFTDGINPLHLTAYDGDTRLTKIILSSDFYSGYINEVDTVFGWTPLMVATFMGKDDVAAILIENGARTDIESNQGENRISLAKRHLDQSLVASMALAPNWGIEEQLDNFSRSVGGINFRNEDYAAEKEDAERVTNMVGEAGDVGIINGYINFSDVRDVNQWTPLMYTSLGAGKSGNNSQTAAKLLSSSRTVINAVDDNGTSALILAVLSRANGEYIDLLLGKGADPDKRNKSGLSARNIATSMNNTPALVAFQDVPEEPWWPDIIIKARMNSQEWSKVQRKLASLGLYDGAIDGLTGPKTKRGVYAYFKVYFEELERRALLTCSYAEKLDARQIQDSAFVNHENLRGHRGSGYVCESYLSSKRRKNVSRRYSLRQNTSSVASIVYFSNGTVRYSQDISLEFSTGTPFFNYESTAPAFSITHFSSGSKKYGIYDGNKLRSWGNAL